MKKKLAVLGLTGLLAVSTVTTAFAYEEMVQDPVSGEWFTQNGIDPEVWIKDEHGWFRQIKSRQIDNVAMGNYIVDYIGWHWIDGNGDGVGECYYFGENHYILTDTVTSDGYTVNADGAWIENGVVQTVGQNVYEKQEEMKRQHELQYEETWKILNQCAEGDDIVVRRTNGQVLSIHSRTELEENWNQARAVASIIESLPALEKYYGN